MKWAHETRTHGFSWEAAFGFSELKGKPKEGVKALDDLIVWPEEHVGCRSKAGGYLLGS